MADFWAETFTEGEPSAVAEGDLLSAAKDLTTGVFTIDAFLAEDLSFGVVIGGDLLGVPSTASD